MAACVIKLRILAKSGTHILQLPRESVKIKKLTIFFVLPRGNYESLIEYFRSRAQAITLHAVFKCLSVHAFENNGSQKSAGKRGHAFRK